MVPRGMGHRTCRLADVPRRSRPAPAQTRARGAIRSPAAARGLRHPRVPLLVLVAVSISRAAAHEELGDRTSNANPGVARRHRGARRRSLCADDRRRHLRDHRVADRPCRHGVHAARTTGARAAHSGDWRAPAAGRDGTVMTPPAAAITAFWRDLGLDPASARARRAIDLVRANLTWGPEFGNSPFFEGEVEPCINGRVVVLGAYCLS